jgi:hypothetical protein
VFHGQGELKTSSKNQSISLFKTGYHEVSMHLYGFDKGIYRLTLGIIPRARRKGCFFSSIGGGVLFFSSAGEVILFSSAGGVPALLKSSPSTKSSEPPKEDLILLLSLESFAAGEMPFSPEPPAELGVLATDLPAPLLFSGEATSFPIL